MNEAKSLYEYQIEEDTTFYPFLDAKRFLVPKPKKFYKRREPSSDVFLSTPINFKGISGVLKVVTVDRAAFPLYFKAEMPFGLMRLITGGKPRPSPKQVPLEYQLDFKCKSLMDFDLLSNYYMHLRVNGSSFLMDCADDVYAKDVEVSTRRGHYFWISNRFLCNPDGDEKRIALPQVLDKIAITEAKISRYDDEQDMIPDPINPRVLIPV